MKRLKTNWYRGIIESSDFQIKFYSDDVCVYMYIYSYINEIQRNEVIIICDLHDDLNFSNFHVCVALIATQQP